jgi:KDEL-tailed cysteine endopeptidase
MATDAFAYLSEHLQQPRDSYPYMAVDQTCAYNATLGVPATRVYENVVMYSSEQRLTTAVHEGPTAVSVHASETAFRSYTSGVLNGPACGTATNHAIVAVGFGEDQATGLHYYIVRNSWGADWGDNGYVKIANTQNDSGVGETGVCGILAHPTYPGVTVA